MSITFSRPEQGAWTCEGEIELHPLKGVARRPEILQMDFFFMALVKLYMSKVVNVEEKPSYAESHVGLVKAGGCGEPKLQTPLTLPQFQGRERHRDLWPAGSRTHQGECGIRLKVWKCRGLERRAATERKDLSFSHHRQWERTYYTMNNNPEIRGCSKVGVGNEFLKAHTHTHK